MRLISIKTQSSQAKQHWIRYDVQVAKLGRKQRKEDWKRSGDGLVGGYLMASFFLYLSGMLIGSHFIYTPNYFI